MDELSDKSHEAQQPNKDSHEETFLDIFWKTLERDIGDMPIYLKNLLNLTGFDNILSLTSITEPDIHCMEQFARSEMATLLPAYTHLPNYYNIYSNNPNLFKIVIGHKKLLLRISEYANTKGIEYFNKQSKEAKAMNIYSKKSYSQYKSSKPVSEILLKLCNNWLDNVTNGERKLFNTDVTMTKTLNIEPQANSGVVICSYCSGYVRVSTQYLKNGNKRWIISNFVKHFQKHIMQANQEGKQKLSIKPIEYNSCYNNMAIAMETFKQFNSTESQDVFIKKESDFDEK